MVTYALSGKIRQLENDPHAALCGDWFTGQAVATNLGHVLLPANAALMEQVRAAFAQWYQNGHTDESDSNTVLLRLQLTSGVIFSHGARYELTF